MNVGFSLDEPTNPLADRREVRLYVMLERARYAHDPYVEVCLR